MDTKEKLHVESEPELSEHALEIPEQDKQAAVKAELDEYDAAIEQY